MRYSTTNAVEVEGRNPDSLEVRSNETKQQRFDYKPHWPYLRQWKSSQEKLIKKLRRLRAALEDLPINISRVAATYLTTKAGLQAVQASLATKGEP